MSSSIVQPTEEEVEAITATAGLQGDALKNRAAQVKMQQILANYRLTPATLMTKLNDWFIPSKWVQYLSMEIAQCISRGSCGLLISAPPRHGKSELSTVGTPLWTLENFPWKNVVIATYGEELSTDFSLKVRDGIQNNQHLLNVRLRKDAQRLSNFLTTRGGGLKAVGLGGAITGRGADVLIIDDYIKQAKEAMSASYLEDLWTWFSTVARTRLEPGGVIIILATRWVANDLHGRIMANQKLTGRSFYKYIQLPALATEDNDVLGRRFGEPLFPERYSQADLHAIRDEVGARWFEAMFQQNPQGNDTATTNPDWLKPMTREEFQDWVALRRNKAGRLTVGRSWDFASTKNAGDFTSGPRCFYDPMEDIYVIEDMIRGQYSSNKVESVFQNSLKEDRKHWSNFKVGMEQEPGSSGAYAVRHFQKLASEASPGILLHETRASGGPGKLLNAQPFLAACEAGKVYIVQGPWTPAFIEEFTLFPEGAHDDQIDAVSHTYKMLTGKKGISSTWGRSAAARQAASTIKSRAPSSQRTSVGATFGRRY